MNPDQMLIGLGERKSVVTRKSSGTESSPNVDHDAGRNTAEHSRAEKEILNELQQKDREVRQHEQQHMLAAGSLAKGPPRFEYQIGPDGKPYAIGGRVAIDTSMDTSDPELARRKQAQIRNAAMAPGDPSIQDQLVFQSIAQQSPGNRSTGAYHPYATIGSAEQVEPAWQLRLYA
ncbi:MAG: hypothetical protein KDK39_09525 [Leptospiraceae bacterium]|nr:hypothetical protein [Leptospiraceae bacterium]